MVIKSTTPRRQRVTTNQKIAYMIVKNERCRRCSGKNSRLKLGMTRRTDEQGKNEVMAYHSASIEVRFAQTAKEGQKHKKSSLMILRCKILTRTTLRPSTRKPSRSSM